MSFNKLDLLLYIQKGTLTRILYIMAFLIIIIPVCIVLTDDVIFSPKFSNIIFALAYLLFFIGKGLTIITKKLNNESISIDLGILTGVSFALIFNLIN